MTDLLGLLLGGGGVAMLVAIVQAVRSLREGAKADEKDAYADVETARRNEARRASRAEKERDYWRGWAGDLEYVIRTQLGNEALPVRPPYPALDEEE